MGIGIILSAPALARVVLNVRVGKLADELGRVPLMVCGSLLAAGGTFLTGMAGSVFEVVPARLLTGVGSCVKLKYSTTLQCEV